MKYCPTCNRTYEDDTASFCLKDATPLADGQSPGELSVAVLPGQPQQPMAPTPASQNIRSQNFDSIVTPTQVYPVKLEDTMFPSGTRKEDSQDIVSPDVSDQRNAGARRLVFDLSQPTSSQPKLQTKSPTKPPTKSQPKSKLARKRRLLLLLVVVGAAALLIGTAGVVFGWQYYKTTSAYRLATLVDAVNRNDNATVDQIIAMDRITDTFASQLTQNVLSQNTSAATDSGRKQLESSLTGLSPRIKQTVREEVEKQVRDEAAPSAGKSFLMIALAVPYKVRIKQDGDTATVTPQVHPVEWTMQRSSGGPWTIVAVKDDALASRLQNQLMSELPTTGGDKTRAGASRQKNPAASAQQNSPASAQQQDPPASAQQKNQPVSAQQKNSTASSRAKKKARKTPKEGIQIELRRIPWPE